jgi:hypothetical protein
VYVDNVKALQSVEQLSRHPKADSDVSILTPKVV